jgi:hypothetical protein
MKVVFLGCRLICHEVGTYNLKKITLSAFDDKRYLYTDGVRSLAYGHVRLTSKKDGASEVVGVVKSVFNLSFKREN